MRFAGCCWRYALDNVSDTRALRFAIFDRVQVHSRQIRAMAAQKRRATARAGDPGLRGPGRSVLECACRTIRLAEHLVEDPVIPGDQQLRGAEVHHQFLRLKRRQAGTAAARILKESDLGLAKSVDRLLGIADEEQRIAFAIRASSARRRTCACPLLGEPLQQLHLRDRSVLELIDQEVLYAAAQRERNPRGFGRIKSRKRGLRNLDEIASSPFGENDLQLGCGQRQSNQQRAHALPLFLAVSDRRQNLAAAKRRRQSFGLPAVAERGEQLLAALLVRPERGGKPLFTVSRLRSSPLLFRKKSRSPRQSSTSAGSSPGKSSIEHSSATLLSEADA